MKLSKAFQAGETASVEAEAVACLACLENVEAKSGWGVVSMGEGTGKSDQRLTGAKSWRKLLRTGAFLLSP